jgi:cytochrome c5
MHRAKQNAIGPLLARVLLPGWLALALLTVDTRYATLAAQTETQAQPQTQTKPQSAEPPLPDGPGKDVVLRACVKCHTLKVITSKRATDDEWASSVNNMVNRGAVLSDDEIDEVIDYLSKNFKPAESGQKQPPETAKQD